MKKVLPTKSISRWLYTIGMTEGTPRQTHLNEFSSIMINLKKLEVKIEDQDKAILICWLSLCPHPISTLRRLCYIVTMKFCYMRMLSVRPLFDSIFAPI